MGDGECGHRAGHVEHRRLKAGHRHPGAAFASQHSGQEQGQQEQHVIIPGPDVMDARADGGHKLTGAGPRDQRDLEVTTVVVKNEDARAAGRCAR